MMLAPLADGPGVLGWIVIYMVALPFVVPAVWVGARLGLKMGRDSIGLSDGRIRTTEETDMVSTEQPATRRDWRRAIAAITVGPVLDAVVVAILVPLAILRAVPMVPAIVAILVFGADGGYRAFRRLSRHG